MSLRIFVILLVVKLIFAGSLYDTGDDLVELTSDNFKLVIEDVDQVWIVQFYAPWCSTSKHSAPDYKKAASDLKGIVKIGAIDCDDFVKLCNEYRVSNVPTIRVFTGKDSIKYDGKHTAEAIVEAAMRAKTALAVKQSQEIVTTDAAYMYEKDEFDTTESNRGSDKIITDEDSEEYEDTTTRNYDDDYEMTNLTDFFERDESEEEHSEDIRSSSGTKDDILTILLCSFLVAVNLSL